VGGGGGGGHPPDWTNVDTGSDVCTYLMKPFPRPSVAHTGAAKTHDRFRVVQRRMELGEVMAVAIVGMEGLLKGRKRPGNHSPVRF